MSVLIQRARGTRVLLLLLYQINLIRLNKTRIPYLSVRRIEKTTSRRNRVYAYTEGLANVLDTLPTPSLVSEPVIPPIHYQQTGDSDSVFSSSSMYGWCLGNVKLACLVNVAR